MVISVKIKPFFLTLLVAIVPAVYAVNSVFLSESDVTENTKKESSHVTYSDIDRLITTTGVLKPNEQVSVGAQVNGRLNKLHVKEGDAVKKGQLLAEIDPTLAQNDVDSAKSELDNALAQKKITLLSLKQSKSDYNRQKKMSLDDATTLSDLETAKTKYESDKEQLDINEIQIAQARVKLNTAQANLAYTRITSPIDGVVLGILTQEGQTIVSSQSAPTILVVANLDIMTVNIKISEMDILKTRVGMPLWFTVTASPDTRYKGMLNRIQQIPEEMLYDMKSSSGDSAGSKKTATYYNGSFDVVNDQHVLKPAMSVQVYLVVEEKKNVKAVPTNYLGEMVSKDHYIVNVLHNNKIEKRRVQTGIKNAKITEIVKGLEIGDIIIKGGD
ncbi:MULTISPECIES: efflux RND transporter periplasmic adaptor subunit [Enterobacteriaceae]|uniref:efflux RND transporter periplasmic adaptor subunit n=1 Tax=Enterobacteriaceae TaxID=543 RepID=UPI00034F0A7D|nr:MULTISPECIES: efflux RND transporter periplasmic adaptor subunit [Enterobacteriaceae]AGN84947.1 hypothetical protein H650_07060 [Enterobacter sp. R4-368]